MRKPDALTNESIQLDVCLQQAVPLGTQILLAAVTYRLVSFNSQNSQYSLGNVIAMLVRDLSFARCCWIH
jgi:hypothetical protein